MSISIHKKLVLMVNFLTLFPIGCGVSEKDIYKSRLYFLSAFGNSRKRKNVGDLFDLRKKKSYNDAVTYNPTRERQSAKEFLIYKERLFYERNRTVR